MARNVYAWPPVDAVGTMWSVSQPINRSRNFFTGFDLTSSAERKRKVAMIEVPGIGSLAGTMNGGYCEVLKDLLAGGEHLVRLNSMPVNWYFDEDVSRRTDSPTALNWTSGGTTLNWTSGGVTLNWGTGGNVLPGTLGSSGGWPFVQISGLPPGALIARPGEYVTGYNTNGTDPTTAKVLRPAYANSAGFATIYLMTALDYAEHVSINSLESAVFQIDGDLPSATQPVDGNWSYTWPFREVFSDEVGGFTEIDPWT